MNSYNNSFFCMRYTFAFLPFLLINTAFAAGEQLTFGGDISTQLGYVRQTGNFKYNDPDVRTLFPERVAIVNDSKLYIHHKGVISQGLKYGGKVGLFSDTSASKQAKGGNVEYTFAYLESKFGKLEAGSYYGVADGMRLKPIEVGTGGVFGDSVYFLNPALSIVNQSYTSRVFLTQPEMLSNYSLWGVPNNKSSVANKVSYLTPKWNGLQLGVTYIPDLNTHGTVAQHRTVGKSSVTNLDALDIAQKQMVTGAMNFEHSFNQLLVKAGVLAESGKSKDVNKKDVKSYMLSGLVSYSGLELYGAYGNHNKSGLSKVGLYSKKRISFYTAAINYSYKQFGLGVSHFASKTPYNVLAVNDTLKKPNTFRNTVISADYKITSGFKSYIEYSKSHFKDIDTNGEFTSNGDVFLLGTKIVF